MENNIENLLKTTDSKSTIIDNPDLLVVSKKKIKSICTALCIESKDYDPQKTITTIRGYLNSKTNKERILYSEITSFVYHLEEVKQGNFITNIEKLLIYALDDNNSVEEDCSKIVIKIYDHIHLAISQKGMAIDTQETANKVIFNKLQSVKKDVKEELSTDTKRIEKEYITILGIFAAIVFAFIGGITFSSSVLQNIDAVSIYRLLIVIDLLAMILINSIYVLVKFIMHINDKGKSLFQICNLNIIMLLIAILIIIAWLLDAKALAETIRGFLPWIK